MMRFASLVPCMLIAISVESLKLPSYFRRCRIDDLHLGQCISDAANIVITRLVKGNQYFGLPPLSVFKISDIYSPIDTIFRFKLEDGTAGKLEDIRYIFSSYDRQTKAAVATAFFPELNIEGRYELEGTVEDVPVSGKGLANIKFEDVYCKLYWNLTLNEREGTRYVNVSGLSVVYEIKNAIYSLANLFDGDVAQGERAIQHLNNHWQILAKIIGPVVIQNFSDVALRIGRAITPKIPLMDLFIY